jgi:hypothetical protein
MFGTLFFIYFYPKVSDDAYFNPREVWWSLRFCTRFSEHKAFIHVKFGGK